LLGQPLVQRFTAYQADGARKTLYVQSFALCPALPLALPPRQEVIKY
jgi:hypothetical protein